MDGSGAAAVVAVRMLILLQLNAKCLIHGSDRSGENNRAACRTLFLDREFVFAGECLDASNAFGSGTVALFEFFTAQNGSFGDRFGECVGADNGLFPCARAQTDGD